MVALVFSGAWCEAARRATGWGGATPGEKVTEAGFSGEGDGKAMARDAWSGADRTERLLPLGFEHDGCEPPRQTIRLRRAEPGQ